MKQAIFALLFALTPLTAYAATPSHEQIVQQIMILQQQIQILLLKQQMLALQQPKVVMPDEPSGVSNEPPACNAGWQYYYSDALHKVVRCGETPIRTPKLNSTAIHLLVSPS